MPTLHHGQDGQDGGSTVVCVCTRCRPVRGGIGRRWARSTRANHISADRKRFDSRNYDKEERELLSDALRDNLLQIASEENAERLRSSGQSTGQIADQTVIPSANTASPGSASEPLRVREDAAERMDQARQDLDAGGSEQAMQVDSGMDDADDEPDDAPPTEIERHDFFRTEARWGMVGRESDEDSEESDEEEAVHVGHEKLQELLSADFPIKHRSKERPMSAPVEPFLSASDMDTLEFLHCWMHTHGTLEAFEVHAKSHRRKDTPIPSVYKAQKLATEASGGLEFEEYEMCPSSCVAFLGRHADLDRCPECNRSRYTRSRTRPAKLFRYIPLLPRLQAMYGSPDLSERLRYRAERTRSASTGAALDHGLPDSHRFSDLHDGFESIGQANVCQDERDCFVAISTDGSQLISNRKRSSAWMVLVQILNLPPTERFAIENHHFSLLVPGTSQPKDLQSFLWPLCAELAHLQEDGAWTWDGAKKEWFLLRVLLAGVYADQKGSVKLSMHVGGNGARGCRFCEIMAVFADNDGSSAYFPLRAMVKHTDRNRGRPNYDPWNLPHRTKQGYVDGIEALGNLRGPRKADVVRQTGITELPLVSFSRLFGSPYFFPIDPFHLLHLNVPGNMWKAWKTLGSAPDSPFGLSEVQRQRLGLFIADNESGYPSSFMSKAPRDIHVYGNTQYRAVEWACTFHHFVPAFLYEINAPAVVQELVSTYVQAVDMTLTRGDLRAADIETIRAKFISVVQLWESTYAATDSGLQWMTISLHQLLHVADQLLALGSVKATSQASCERYLGAVKHNVKQYRYPHRVVENRALQKIRMSVLTLRHPDLPEWITEDPAPKRRRAQREGLGTVIRRSTHRSLTDDELRAETLSLRLLPGIRLSVRRYGKLALRSKDLVRSKRVEPDEVRCASNVAIIDPADNSISFAEVIEFLHVKTTEGEWDAALVRAFSVTNSQPTFSVGSWTNEYSLVDVNHIVEIVGVLRSGSFHYVIRKRSWQATTNVLAEQGEDNQQANEATEQGHADEDGDSSEEEGSGSSSGDE
ncbi:hypothetical protein CF327_g4425 [Tilletia walkeri]|nr:hypothetical protein CF327_g4425 [Tilletia walkeri]